MSRGYQSMEMAEQSDRRQAIATAIAAELERQAQAGAPRVDIEALASAIEAALDPAPPASEGKHPDELNATNDD